jgi:hypothetical protein
MDGDRLQAKIYAGFAKEAERTGFDYELYRSASPMNPMAPQNLLGSIKCAFMAEKDAATPNKYQTPTWLLRADGRLLQQFDILVGPFGTFYVGSMQPQLPIEAVLANSTVSIGRASYTTVGGIPGITIPKYAEGLPMFKQYRREDIRRNSATGDIIGASLTHWRAFIPLANGLLKQGDQVTDEAGINYTVDAPDFTSVGYAASIRLANL